MGPLLLLLCAAGAANPAPVVIDVEPGVISAARALGPSIQLYTSQAHPLAALSQISDSASQVGTGDVAGAKEIQALLRAGGVKLGGGAVDLMHLYSGHHFASLFRAHPALRLFIVQARDDGRERLVMERGGGVRLQLRARGQLAGTADSRPLAPPGPFVTSFGPLAAANLSPTARQRQWDAQEGARTSQRQARDGHTFLVLHIERDFHTGAGLVSFLFGSGIVIKPELEQLVVAAGKTSYPLAATFAEGRTVELTYEVPTGTRGLVLRDGDDECPLDPLLRAKQAAN